MVVGVVVTVVAVAARWGDSGPGAAERYVADLPLVTALRWELLAACESDRQWDLATGNRFFGGLQFTQESWNGVGGTGSPASASRSEQIMRAAFLYDLQGWEAWPSCSRQLGFTVAPLTRTGG